MNEKIIGLATLDLSNLKNLVSKISGEWNGDNPGIQEDKAHLAEDIIVKIDELKKLLDELDQII